MSSSQVIETGRPGEVFSLSAIRQTDISLMNSVPLLLAEIHQKVPFPFRRVFSAYWGDQLKVEVRKSAATGRGMIPAPSDLALRHSQARSRVVSWVKRQARVSSGQALGFKVFLVGGSPHPGNVHAPPQTLVADLAEVIVARDMLAYE